MGMPGCPPVRCQWRTDYCCQGGCTWYVKSVKRKNGIGRSGVECSPWRRRRAGAGGRKEKQKKPALLSFRSLQIQSPDSPSVRPSVRPTALRSDARPSSASPSVRVRPSVCRGTHGMALDGMALMAGEACCGAEFRSFVRSSDGSLQLPPIPPISTPPSFYPTELSR